MPNNPNSKPCNGKKPIKAVAVVNPIRDDKTNEPQALQPMPKKPITKPEIPTLVSFFKINC